MWICRDKETGRPRGDGIVGYDMPQAASLAIERFHSTCYTISSLSLCLSVYVSNLLYVTVGIAYYELHNVSICSFYD